MLRTSIRLGAGLSAAVVALLLSIGTSPVGASPSAPAFSPSAGGAGSAPVISGAGKATAIPGEYKVGLKDTASVRAHGVEARARALSSAHHGTFGHSWDPVLPAFSVTMSERDALQLAAEPDVAYVEQSQRYTVAGTVSQANPPSWGLDRVDQRRLPLNNAYAYDDSAGTGVHVYIVDSGIRIDHTDFGGRATYGRDTRDNDNIASDCLGHGTEVAGVVGGATYGVAKKAQLVAVRVFDCLGVSGATSIEDGIKWVIDHAIKPAVINMSIAHTCRTAAGVPTACPAGTAAIIVGMMNAAITAGITFVVAAGNDAIDACGNPFAAVPDAITVGATDMTDTEAGFSDYGPCLDLYAPGVGITSAYKDSTTDKRTVDGTSFAAPHVAGAAAVLLGTPQFQKATPAQIGSQLLADATDGVLFLAGGGGSPNKLLYVDPAADAGGSSIALVRNQNKRLELFGVNSDGYVFHRSEVTAGTGAWDGWIRSEYKGWASVGAEPGADSRIELAALTSTDLIAHRQQATINNISYFGWRTLDGLLTSVGIARNGDGRLEMVGTNRQGQLFYRKQTDANSLTWGPFIQLPFSGFMRSIAVAANRDGQIQIVGVDNGGKVWQTRQISANLDVWTTVTEVAGSPVAREVALASEQDGTLELIGTDVAGVVWQRQQDTTDANTWLGATQLPAKTLRHVAAETDVNNLVTVVGVDPDGNIWQSKQASANLAAYTPWTQIDGQLRP